MGNKKPIKLVDNSARNIAVNSLLAFEREGRDVGDYLNEQFEKGTLEERDRRLAREAAYGSCRHKITLDYLIAKKSRRPLRKLDPAVRAILRVGLYQMIYLNRTPDFAAVHEAVEQARAGGVRGTDSFVNAVLRSVQRDMAAAEPGGETAAANETGEIYQLSLQRRRLERDDGTYCLFNADILPDLAKNRVKFYSLAFGHPPWLVERWLKQFDEETVRSLLRAGNARPLLTLRVNRLRSSTADVSALLENEGIQHRCSGQAIQLLQPANPEYLPGYDEGLFCVQDATAMEAGPMLGPAPGERVLDLCAAPGGKATHLAELMENRGEILACDIATEKLSLIEANCRRLGISIVKTCLAEELAAGFEGGKARPSFDRVLVDAPCSNTGVLARRVEVRHRLKPAAIARLARQQMALLEQAGSFVKPGGRLLYSTCSIDKRENSLLAKKFLQENSGFALLKEKLTLPQAGDEASLRCDGGYLALLERR